MLDLLTIVIPTHNRPLLIARALEYYNAWNCRIIICDSSSEAGPIAGNKNVEYLHYPNEFYGRKMNKALQYVKTPFVCLSPDDDFLSVHGMNKGLAFLQQNEDYVSVHGMYIQFRKVQDNILCYPHNEQFFGININSDDPGDRILSSVGLSIPHTHALHRTIAMQESISLCKDFTSSFVIEYTTSFSTLIFGKHRMLPIFWMARDIERYTTFNYTKNDVNALMDNFQFSAFIESEEGIRLKDAFAKLFNKITKESLEQGYKIFEQAFHVFTSKKVAKPKEAEKKSKAFNLIRSFAPGKLAFIKSFLYWNPVFLISDRLYKHKSPFHKTAFKKDWKWMQKVIRNHGNIPTVADGRI